MKNGDFWLMVLMLSGCFAYNLRPFDFCAYSYLFAAFVAVLLSFIKKAGNSAGKIYRFIGIAILPICAFYFAFECVSFYKFAQNGRIFVLFLPGAVITYAFCAALAGVRGFKRLERASLPAALGVAALIICSVSVRDGGGIARTGDRGDLVIFFLPAVCAACCVITAQKSRPLNCFFGAACAFGLYSLMFFFVKSGVFIAIIALVCGVFRGAVIAYALSVNPKLLLRGS